MLLFNDYMLMKKPDYNLMFHDFLPLAVSSTREMLVTNSNNLGSFEPKLWRLLKQLSDMILHEAQAAFND